MTSAAEAVAGEPGPMARPGRGGQTQGQSARLLLFEIGASRFGLPEGQVVELLAAMAMTPLPHAPSIVEGIIDIRGRVVPVLDVRRRFRLAPKPLAPSDHLIVANAGGRRVALRVDRACELVTIARSAIVDAQAIASGTEYLAGIAALPDGLVLIQDLGAFLSQAEAEALAAALEAR